jgi:hypothetical protein
MGLRIEGALRVRRIEAFVGPAGLEPAVVQLRLAVARLR